MDAYLRDRSGNLNVKDTYKVNIYIAIYNTPKCVHMFTPFTITKKTVTDLLTNIHTYTRVCIETPKYNNNNYKKTIIISTHSPLNG